MKINWVRCLTYDAAKNYTGIIYLHEWDDKPFYWGKAHRSFFGGHSRKHANETKMSGRYNVGYRHWIEGCLQHGAKLYIGQLDAAALAQIDAIEHFLIHTYSHVMNTKIAVPAITLTIEHTGEIPASIKPVVNS